MSVYEAQRLLAEAGLAVDDETAERLADRTEGWPAGIYLAGLSSQTRAHEGEHDAPLAGDAHMIAEYIGEEVLGPLPPAARSMLVRTSILDRLSGELCDAVLEVRGTGQTLRDLAAGGMMLIPQDSAHRWYRCHTLLRDMLRSELEMSDPGEVPRLHARASEWFAARGDIADALDHAAAARDATRTGRLLWDDPSRFLNGQDEQVGRWLSSFTAEEIASSPRISFALAHSHMACGDLPAARREAHAGAEGLAQAADDARPPSLLASVALIEAATGTGGIEQVSQSAEHAYTLVGEASSLRPLCCLLRGVSLHLMGKRESGRGYLDEGIDACTEATPFVEALTLTQLALMDMEDGDWEQAEDRTSHAVALLADHGLDTQRTAALPIATFALAMSHRGVADEAKRALIAASRLLASLDEYMPWYEVETRIVMARTSIRLADVSRARSLLSQASRTARRPRPVPCFVAWLDDAWSEIDDASATALNGPGSLTMAELRVLRFLPTHLSFREIGERLHVSGNTVKSQAHSVYAKLGAASRTEAVANASALGLIDAPVT